MNRVRSIFHDELVQGSVWYTVSNFLVKGVTFLTIPLFTRMMTTSQYGVVNNFTAWVSITTILVGLNLNSAISNAALDYRGNLNNFISSIVEFSTILFVAGELISNSIFWLTDFHVAYFNSTMIQGYAMYVVSIGTAYYTIGADYLKNSVLSVLTLFSNIIISIVFMITIYSGKPAEGRIYGSTVGLSILTIIIIVTVIVNGDKKVHFEYIKYAARISIPVIPHSVGGVVLSQFDRIMISQYTEDTSAGIFSFVYNVSMVINVLWISVNNAWIPWFFRKASGQQYALVNKMIRRISWGFLVLTMGAITVLVDLAKVMAPASYQSGISLLIPISMSYLLMFLYSFSVNYEFFLKKTWFLGISTVLSALLNILLNMYYIPKYGYVAAGYTTLVTYFVLFLSHYFIAYSLGKKRENQFLPTGVMTSIIIVAGIYSILTLVFFNFVLIRYLIFMALCFVAIACWLIDER